MKRKRVNFTWENEDAQKVFAEWVPFPDAQSSARDVDAIGFMSDEEIKRHFSSVYKALKPNRFFLFLCKKI